MERDKLFLIQYEQVWLQRRQHVGHVWAIPTIVTALVGGFVTLAVNHKIDFISHPNLKIVSLNLIGIGLIGLFLRHNFFIKALGLLLKDLAKRAKARKDLPQFGKDFKKLYWRDLSCAERCGARVTATIWWIVTVIGLIVYVLLNWNPLTQT